MTSANLQFALQLLRTGALPPASRAAVAVGYRTSNDGCTAPALEYLRSQGVQLLLNRCAGFNNVDMHAADRHGMRVMRVCSTLGGPSSIICARNSLSYSGAMTRPPVRPASSSSAWISWTALSSLT